MSNSNEELSELHTMVCKGIKANLKIKDDNGYIRPQDLANAIKFLKDNGIEAAPEYSKPLQSVMSELDGMDFANVVNFK
jgi:hypothetical protein